MSRSYKYYFIIISCGLIFCLGFPLFVQGKGRKIIRKIIIQRSNIYDPGKKRFDEFPYLLINKMHLVTQEEIIRRELLFREGDIYDENLVKESERNLRRFTFLGEVEIISRRLKGDKVDILVKTVDQWTTLIGTSFKTIGNKYSYSLDLTEKNLLGRAYEVSYRLKHESKGNTQEIGIINPRLAGSRIRLAFNNLQGPQQNIIGADMQRPFYSLAAKWSYGLKAEERRVFSSGEREEDENLRLFVARSLGDVHRVRIIPAFNWGRNIHEQDLKREVKKSNKAELALDFFFDSYNYTQITYLDKFGRTEDLFLGNILTLSYGREDPLWGSTEKKDTFFAGNRKIFRLGGEDSYLSLKFGLSTHKGFIKGNYLLSSHKLDLRYYYKELPFQTIVLHLAESYSEGTLFLGGENGLRGYGPDEFIGSKKIVFNLEDRLFIYQKFLFSLVEPGATLFFDSGFVWKKQESIILSELKSSAGFGLRFYLVKSANYNVINLNLAYPFNTPQRGVVLTLGTSGSF